MRTDLDSFLRFLIQAKKATYAAQGDDASVPPVLPGSKQLEYRSGDYLYRDIYFGMGFFAGQEVVSYQGRPIWSLVCAGGMTPRPDEAERMRPVCAFLRQALRLVDETSVFRGPERFADGGFLYQNVSHGGGPGHCGDVAGG
jgi:hypothetical protein